MTSFVVLKQDNEFVALLQDEHMTMSAFGSGSEVILENVLKHNSNHATFNVHKRVHSQPGEAPPNHNVTTFMFHCWKNVVAVKVAARMMNTHNDISSYHLHALLLSLLICSLAN